MVKLSELLAEVSALETGMTKAASKKPASKIEQLASAIDKIAEEMEAKEEDEKSESEEENKKEEEKEEEKEASMKMSNALVDKIATAVIRKLEKIAVDSGPNTQGSVVNEGPKNSDGAATNAARNEDHIVSGDSVAFAAASNPEKNAPEDGDNTIEKSPLNEVGDRPAPLGGVGANAASVTYTAREAEVLNKLAAVGYEYLVDYHSDQIVREKIAQAIIAERAKQAPEKIAKALVAGSQEKTASTNENQLREKLAEVATKDPELFKAIHVLAKRNLL